MDFTSLPSQESKINNVEMPDFKKGMKIYSDFFIWYLDTTEKIVQTGKVSKEDFAKYVKVSELLKGGHPEDSKDLHPEIVEQMKHLMSNIQNLLREVSKKKNGDQQK